ncbi:metallophosphoesterase [Tsukamurella sp. 8F]|uniref:metallophosphoesterase n=1 Tax=unclassified Tsukamurella TaxID=2633480 RepID=UPI0023B9611C|nr:MULTISPECIES: metallophosphoesterase [unclassified Tsukamurella]MDF0530568.1 metallophosphoesterase [Tsukamurella sp. 8J]MDF0586782.1 metallophosphoesterase [Tsukamurella sp. 8F]
MSRVAVMGDVAGHLTELQVELKRLGARDDVLPDDLTVVQVGDLVHRGPDSDAVIALVDHYLRNQPTQWVQLIGNHEAQYLHAPVFRWPQRLRRRSAATLRRWVHHRSARAGVAIVTDSEHLLVTHAGVTEAFWRVALRAPETAEEAAAALNEMLVLHDDRLFRPGVMLGRHDPAAGPLWAQSLTELVPGWLAGRLPFSQVYGHSTVNDWIDPVGLPPAIAHRITSDHASKHEIITLDGGRLIGIDPGHHTNPVIPWRSLELQGHVV